MLLEIEPRYRNLPALYYILNYEVETASMARG